MSLPWNKYPYTDFHQLNDSWVIESIKALGERLENFITLNSLVFADPLQWDITKNYAVNTIVIDENGDAYLSTKPVPAGVLLSNSEYWVEVFNFTAYVEKANKNLTDHYEKNVNRATANYSTGDWLVWDDVLYKVTQNVAEGAALEIGVNVEHFTVEDFLKDFITTVNATILQYKNDIDASELAYRNQLAGDIATTTQSLQAQLDAAISAVTVDSEVINARVGYLGNTYNTLGDAVRGQVGDIHTKQLHDAPFGTTDYGDHTYIKWSDGSVTTSGHDYRIATPEYFKKGSVIVITADMTPSAALLAKVTYSGGVISNGVPLVIGGSYTDFVWVVEEDGYYAISYEPSIPHTFWKEDLNSTISNGLEAFGEIGYTEHVQKFSDGYVNVSGTLSTNTGYSHSDPIYCNKGDIFVAYCNPHASNVAVLAELKNVSNYYQPVRLPEADEVRYYITTINHAGYYVMSFRKGYEYRGVVYHTSAPFIEGDISLFTDWAVIGDSWSVGAIHLPDNTVVNNINMSWEKILARKCGNNVNAYATGGMTARGWVGRSSATYKNAGVDAFRADTAKQFYAIMLGINDATAGSGDIGSTSDINISDYTMNADTFCGNLGMIIQMIQEKSPNAKILVYGTARTADYPDRVDYNQAMKEVCNTLGVSYVAQEDHPFFKSNYFNSGISHGHPTAVQLSAIANALNDLFSGVVSRDYSYWKDFNWPLS